MIPNNTPVMQATITLGTVMALFKAIVILARTMNWFDLNQDQEKAWIDVIEIVFPILVAAATGWWLARKTTDLAKPTDTDGVRLSRPDGTEAIEEKKVVEREIMKGRSIKR